MTFVKQSSFSVEYSPATISKWRLSRTGLQLTYVNQASPIVNGYFAVATEIPDDSGCPHTLEHLIFMGSEKYPYKGYLDSLGNRFFSSTNAWTAVDKTVYTLTTAGWEGFKTLLPIYLDHLVNPTITDDACLTEVYHVDGHGKEKGVVFSEMQGIESELWFIAFLNMQRTLYAADSGYSSETGGLMAELRHLTSDQIRDFHKLMYRPDNLCVVVTGSIDEEEFLSIMEKFDSALIALPETANKRPFVDSNPVLPLSEEIIKEIEFPDKDESAGALLISWIGPTALETLVATALDMVCTYFSDSAISVLNRNLVEIPNPLATDIEYSTDDYTRTVINFDINGVPTEKLRDVDVQVKKLVSEQANPANFDLVYMRQIIAQQRLKVIERTEKSPLILSNVAISEFVYGNPDGSDLRKWAGDLSEYDTLESWTAEQWTALINQYFVENKLASVINRPSAKLNAALKQQNKEMAESIKRKYGKEGLEKLGNRLKEAQDRNDTPIPEVELTRFGKPDVSKIQFIDTASYRAGANTDEGYIQDKFSDALQKDTPPEFPLYIHYESYSSKFTTIHLIMSSKTIDAPLLRYMSIVEEIFSLSIQLPDGRYLPYEQVISDINNDLLKLSLDNGFSGRFSELLNVKVQFESRKYADAIKWLINVLEYSVFEEDRVRVIVEKIVNSLTDKKRNAELMMYSKQYRTMFNDSSLRKAQDCLNTEEFYKEVLEKINSGKFSDIRDDLNLLRKQLFSLDNIKVFVVGEVHSLANPVSQWKEFVKVFLSGRSPLSLGTIGKYPRSSEYLSDTGKTCSQKAFVVTTPAAESTHLVTSTPIPTDYLDEDIFKIALAGEYLGTLEGPFWRGIRGAGFAYGTDISRNVETGFLNFTIYRGADAEQAWLTAKKIVGDYASGALDLDTISIENSIAALVNTLANSESNNLDAAYGKILDDIVIGRGPNYKNVFLEKLNKVTADDIRHVLEKYFVPLFESKNSVIFTSLPPNSLEAFTKFLEDQGYDVAVEEINAGEDGLSEDEDDELESEDDSEEETESESEGDH